MPSDALHSEPIRTGIVGFGLSGRVFHAPFIAASESFSLEVIATGDPERAASARALHPSAEVVSSPGELIGHDLDLVILASPAHAHLEQGLAALAAGSALVIDKPFAPSSADAAALIAAAAEAGLPLTVFQNRRWDADFLTLQKLIADGSLGRIHRFESTFERWSPALKERWQDTQTAGSGAGITFDLGSHLIDQALTLFGPATVTTAELSVLREGGVSDDEAWISLLHDSGVRSHLTLSRLAGQSGPRFRVLGSEAAYTVYGLDGQEAALRAGASPADEGFGVVPSSEWGVLGIDGSSDEPLHPVPTSPGRYASFYEGVAASIRDGAPPPVSPADALATLQLIEQVQAVAAH